MAIQCSGKPWVARQAATRSNCIRSLNMAVAPIARMVRRQIASRGISDARVLAAMRKVERAAFLPEAMREFAYEDSALPLDQGQTISQPYIVARMAEAAEIAPSDRVLEVGAGSG